MTAEEERQYYGEMDPVGEFIMRLTRKHKHIAAALRAFARTWLGQRILYYAFLQPLARNCLLLMAETDRCAACQQPSFTYQCHSASIHCTMSYGLTTLRP
jgi:hypothetical protein